MMSQLSDQALYVKQGQGKLITVGHDSTFFKACGSQTDGRFDFMETLVHPLQGPPLHIHSEQDDTFYVLEGQLTVQIGEEIMDLGPGDFACARKGTPHTFTNVTDQPVRVLNIMTPGGFDQTLEELLPLYFAETPDPAAIEAVCQKHQVSFIGPTLPMRLGLVPAPEQT